MLAGSQLGKLIFLITGKMIHKGKNGSIKLQNIIFATKPFALYDG